MTSLLQDKSSGIWDNLYKEFEEGKPLGISYPTEALVICVSNLRKKGLDVQQYFEDNNHEYSIKTNYSGKCLEIGFGSIANLKMMAEKGFVCHGLEVSNEAVKRGSAQIEREKLQNIFLQHWSPLDMPFPDNTFNFVYGLQSVYYNLDFKGFIEEVRRVLMPGGQFLFSFFSNRHSYMEYVEAVDGNIAKWNENHPNKRLRGAAFHQPKNANELCELFSEFEDVRVFTTESDQTPLFESWWYVQGTK